MFLPDALNSGRTLESYLLERVESHCPNVTRDVLRDRLRDDGVVLLCDGFDRVVADQRESAEGSLVNFRRDYPKTQLFVITRASALPKRVSLKILTLGELNDEEQFDFVDRFCSIESIEPKVIWYDVPTVLKDVCRHPLILDLVLRSYLNNQGQLPTEIEPLFRTWLDGIIPVTFPVARRVDCRRLLTVIANHTLLRPLGDDEIVNLTRDHNFSTDLLQDLLETDALEQRGRTIELQHEALADYLRALDVTTGRDLSDATARLDRLSSSLQSNSELPVLLMATARSVDLQQLVWSHVVGAGIRAAISALRFRADISYQIDSGDPIQSSRRYLSDIVEGIDRPLTHYFAQLATRIRSELVGEDTELLGIAGSLSPRDREQIEYSFIPRGTDHEPVVVEVAARRRQFFGKNLRMMGLRLDSGRLVGMGHLRDALLKLVNHRRLDGGVVWAEERAMSRLQHLIRAYRLPCTLETDLVEIRSLLEPYNGLRVDRGALGPGQEFEINELLGDLTLLIDRGQRHLEPWWRGADRLDSESTEGRARLAALLDTHYKRTQLAYREITEASFPSVCEEFSLYQMGPLCYEIEVEVYNRNGYTSETLHWTRIPVADFGDAGATVTFPTRPSDMRSNEAVERYGRRVDDALAQYNRSAPSRSYHWGWSGTPDFFGYGIGGHVDETSVMGSTARQIERDIKDLFSDLPGSDHGFY